MQLCSHGVLSGPAPPGSVAFLTREIPKPEGTHAKGSQKGGSALVFSRFTIQASASCWCGYRGFTISAAAGISARGPSSEISAQSRQSSDSLSHSGG